MTEGIDENTFNRSYLYFKLSLWMYLIFNKPYDPFRSPSFSLEDWEKINLLPHQLYPPAFGILYCVSANMNHEKK